MLPLIDKEDIAKKTKSKRERYRYLKERAEKLVSWIYENIDKSNCGEINARARDVAKEFGLEHKSDVAIYSGFRFVLFFEGIIVSIKNNGNENFFTMRRACFGDGMPPSIIKTFDNMELDGWQIKRNYNYLNFKHNIKKDSKKDNKGDDIYILESEGNIYFDRRALTERQALEFVKYMSGKDLSAPDFVYLTPINVLLPEEYFENICKYDNFDIDKIGREFRIVKSGNEFIVTSMYGKECIVHEFEVDSLIKGCSIFHIMNGFDDALMIEKIPERVEILKRIIPEIKTKYVAIIEDKKLVIVNSVGIFYLSLKDGTLHKIYDDNRNRTKYICVGPIYRAKKNFIIYNCVKYEVDIITGAILSKTIMLLEEKYPDKWTETQILT